jgi:hypothetical protein
VARDISERRSEVDDQTAALQSEVLRRERAQKELRLTQFAVDRAADAIFWFGADGCQRPGVPPPRLRAP